jgi:hypothetical protein
VRGRVSFRRGFAALVDTLDLMVHQRHQPVGCAGRTLARVPDWRDDETVNRATAQAFPETPTPLYNLAAYYQNVEGNTAKALQALEEAQKRVPGWKPAIERAAQLRSGIWK